MLTLLAKGVDDRRQLRRGRSPQNSSLTSNNAWPCSAATSMSNLNVLNAIVLGRAPLQVAWFAQAFRQPATPCRVRGLPPSCAVRSGSFVVASWALHDRPTSRRIRPSCFMLVHRATPALRWPPAPGSYIAQKAELTGDARGRVQRVWEEADVGRVSRPTYLGTNGLLRPDGNRVPS